MSRLLAFCSSRDRIRSLTVSKSWNSATRQPVLWTDVIWTSTSEPKRALPQWLQSILGGCSQPSEGEADDCLTSIAFERLRSLHLCHPLNTTQQGVAHLAKLPLAEFVVGQAPLLGDARSASSSKAVRLLRH